VTLILDAGALIAVDRGDRLVAALIKREFLSGRTVKTNGAVVGQAWRGSARQANLSRLLAGVDVVALDNEQGRRAGTLLAKSRTSDVVDASVVLLATDGDEILTSDPNDLRILCEAASLGVDLIPV
jgi:hypothetical protein